MKAVCKKRNAYQRQQLVIGSLFSVTALVLISLFVIFPAILSIYYSLFRYNILMPNKMAFIGLQNFADVLTNSGFYRALRNTAYFALLVVPVQTALALVLAMLVNIPSKIKSLYRLGFFSPVVTSLVVISILWSMMYSSSGMINGLLGLFGIPPQPFLTSSSQAMNSIIFMSVWQSAGYYMMIFLAGLQEIPTELYEAATVDGANAFQRFWHITLPGLSHVTRFVVTVTTIGCFKLFQQPYIMTKGGPSGSTMSVVQFIYEQGIQNRNAGYASAVTVVFLLVIVTLTLLLQNIKYGER